MKMNHYLNVPGLLRRFAKIGLALLLVLPVAFGAGAQDVSPARVSGTVVDQQGMPVVGAGVVVRGTQTGSVTDLDGRFTVMAAKDATLTVSFIGYTTREVPVGTQTDIRIVLEENVQSIDDVVVVGFGTQKKETVTGAIGQLSGKELMRSPVTNISNALVGRIAGMAAVQKTGEAGFEESTIRVRGVGTYAGDQNPLIVIDGIVRDMTAFNMLDPNDVKNVNVLKDASATAVYGVRGANGVIIVTTKRGREGNLKISFTANVGFTSPTTLPSLVNSYDYAVLRNEAFANDGKPDDIKVFSQDELWKFRHNRDYTPSEVEAMGHLSPEQKQALLDSPAIYYGSTDYMKRIFDAGVSPQQQYSVNISGGTEKVAFFTSVGYSNQKSLTNDFGFSDAASNSGSHKYNFRTNFDFNIIPLTEINVSLSGQVRETKIITDRNSSVDMWGRYRDLMLNIYEAPPFSAPGVSDGRIITDYAGGTIMDSNKGAWGKSPIAYMLEKAQARINQSSLNTSIRIRHRMDYLVEGLSVRGALSYDHYFTKTLRVAPQPARLFDHAQPRRSGRAALLRRRTQCQILRGDRLGQKPQGLCRGRHRLQPRFRQARRHGHGARHRRTLHLARAEVQRPPRLLRCGGACHLRLRPALPGRIQHGLQRFRELRARQAVRVFPGRFGRLGRVERTLLPEERHPHVAQVPRLVRADRQQRDRRRPLPFPARHLGQPQLRPLERHPARRVFLRLVERFGQ